MLRVWSNASFSGCRRHRCRDHSRSPFHPGSRLEWRRGLTTAARQATADGLFVSCCLVVVLRSMTLSAALSAAPNKGGKSGGMIDLFQSKLL
jgi:hypothetical protein